LVDIAPACLVRRCIREMLRMHCSIRCDSDIITIRAVEINCPRGKNSRKNRQNWLFIDKFFLYEEACDGGKRFCCCRGFGEITISTVTDRFMWKKGGRMLDFSVAFSYNDRIEKLSSNGEYKSVIALIRRCKENTMVAVSLAAKLLILTCVGFFVQKIKLVKQDFDSQLTAFLLNTAFPCLIFNSMIAEPFSVETLSKCGIVLVVATAVCLLQLGLGHLYYLLSGKTGQGRLARYGITFVHYSFFGIPIMEALFGSLGTMYYSVFLIPVRIMYYGITKPLLLPAGDSRAKQPLSEKMKKILLNPCLIAVVLGLIFWIMGWRMPEIIDYCITSLSKICSPIGLVLCGLTLGKYDLKNLFRLRYLKLPLIRTVIMPAIFFGISRIMLLCGMDATIANMMVVYTALPIASLMAAFVVMYDPDEAMQFEAAGNVFFATLLSIVTLPVWYMILQSI